MAPKLRISAFRGLAAGLLVAGLAPACGGGDSGSTFGSGSGGTSGGKGGTTTGFGGTIVTSGGAGGTLFEAGGGTTGWGGMQGDANGNDTCGLTACPDPPAPATKCCIVDLCGGDFGQGCEPFFIQPVGDPVDHYCNHDAPAGAELGLPPPTPQTQCPQIAYDTTAPAYTIISSGSPRTFRVAVPQGLGNNGFGSTGRAPEKLPILFLWHWLGGDSLSFYNAVSGNIATNNWRFLMVFLDAKGDLPLKWPSEVTASPTRVAEEVQYFEDVYGCVAQQFNVQPNCVSSGGMSAGGLWTPQLVKARPQYFSSFMTFSGGVGSGMRPWVDPPHKSPALVVWGGPGDICGINFQVTSQELETGLTAGGHFDIECIHNCNHSQPPLPDQTPPATKYDPFFKFVFDHPYWLAAGQSPYQQTGLPQGFPYWCSIGAGTATIRTDACQIPTQCI